MRNKRLVLFATLLTVVIAFFAYLRFGNDFLWRTELHIAAEGGDLRTIRKWIAQGRNLNVTYQKFHNLESGTEYGITPLMSAVCAKQLDAAKVLVENGADLYLESSNDPRRGGATAFDCAVLVRDLKMVRFLWEASDKVTYKKHIQGGLSSVYGDLCGSTEIVDLATYLTNIVGPEIASARLSSISPLLSCEESARFLMEHGARPTLGALVQAASAGKNVLVANYIRAGVDINGALPVSRFRVGRIVFKVTPLIAAAENGHLETVELLLGSGAEVDKPDGDGATALIAVIEAQSEYTQNRESRFQLLDELLQLQDARERAQAVATSPPENCPKPGIKPTCANVLKIVNLLLDHGANRDLRDAFGMTARDHVLHPRP